jgi:2-dehydro-3-deoxygluconokinase
MNYDVIALGETMVTFCPAPGETLATATRLLVDHGGAESNTCIGLARLGFRVAWVSQLGADVFGDRVLEALTREGLDTRWVVRDSKRPTGLMFKDPANQRTTYYRAGSAASALGPERLEGVPLAEATALLVTGITALIGPEPQAAAVAFLEAARGLRVVDPNFRRGLWGSDRYVECVMPLIERCDLLLAGENELADLVGPGEPQDLCRRCTVRGPSEAVIRSSGKVGAFESLGGRWSELEFEMQEAADPMGAGDAFNAGYLASRLRGKDVNEALRFALHCGRAVATSAGDTAGFPRNWSE